MFKKTATAAITVSLLTMFGCSSDNDTTIVGSDGSADDSIAGAYMISFTNLSTGQPRNHFSRAGIKCG